MFFWRRRRECGAEALHCGELRNAFRETERRHPLLGSFFKQQKIDTFSSSGTFDIISNTLRVPLCLLGSVCWTLVWIYLEALRLFEWYLPALFLNGKQYSTVLFPKMKKTANMNQSSEQTLNLMSTLKVDITVKVLCPVDCVGLLNQFTHGFYGQYEMMNGWTGRRSPWWLEPTRPDTHNSCSHQYTTIFF